METIITKVKISRGLDKSYYLEVDGVSQEGRRWDFTVKYAGLSLHGAMRMIESIERGEFGPLAIS